MYLATTDRSALSVPTPSSVSASASASASAFTSAQAPELSGETFATFINLSGRRRFTSQRVALYALLAAGKDDPQAPLAIARDALGLFREAHTSLTKGSRELALFMSPALERAYYGPTAGNETILQYLALAERVLHAVEAGWRRQTLVLMDELIESATPLLATLNSLTAIYEAEARNHAKKMERQLQDAMKDIRTISKHAYIVAVNARIVAAHAGASGREFAVVATELISITASIDTVVQSAMVDLG